MDVVADRFELFLGIAAVEGFVDGLFFIWCIGFSELNYAGLNYASEAL